MYCPRCGKENTDNVEYCLFCGERLGRRNKKNGTDPIIYMAIITGILAVLFVIMLVFTFTNTRQKNIVSTAGTREAAQFIETTAALGEPAGQNSVSAQSDMPAAASETASQGPVKEVQNTDALSEAEQASQKTATQNEDLPISVNSGAEGSIYDAHESDPSDTVVPNDVPDQYFYHDGHTYAFYDTEDCGLHSYADVLAFCEYQGGYLAVIDDELESQAVYEFLSGNFATTAFFGYSDEDNEGEWVWSNGSSNYENWTVNSTQHQPDNGVRYHTDEDYAEFNYERNTDSPNDGTWNDAPFRRNTNRFICEWDCVIEDGAPTADDSWSDDAASSDAEMYTYSDLFTDEQIIEIRDWLGVPSDLNAQVSVGNAYYWDGGNIYLAEVDFICNGELVAGAACEIGTSTVVRNIWMYND